MLKLRPPLGRRSIAIAGVLAVAVLGGGASIAAAGSGDPKDATDAAAVAKADAVAAGGAKDAKAETRLPAPDGVPAGLLVQTRVALDALVAGGTIDQAQADGVQARVAAGSVDESEVVDSGLLDHGQMQRVEDVLRTIKLSYAGA